MTKRVNKYFRGELSEEQAIELWKKLLLDDEAFKMLEMMLMLRGFH